MIHFEKIIFPVFGMVIFTNVSFGQKPILDSTAQVTPFAPGVVSTGLDEFATSFSPDNKTVYFMMGAVVPTICFSKNINGQWEKPEVASFSGKWADFDPAISPDGKKLFYSTNRPLPGASPNEPDKNSELWYVESKGDDKWGEPQHLGAPVNTGNESNYAPCVDAAGTIYLCSKDREGNKGVESFYLKLVDGHYQNSRVLKVPGITHIHDPFTAANGNYLVFYTGVNFYVTFATKDGWSGAEKLGAPVSMGDEIISPYVSHDGKTLYFSTNRIDGFYKRDLTKKALNFDGLIKENNNIFNGRANILMVPVNLPDGS